MFTYRWVQVEIKSKSGISLYDSSMYRYIGESITGRLPQHYAGFCAKLVRNGKWIASGYPGNTSITTTTTHDTLEAAQLWVELLTE